VGAGAAVDFFASLGEGGSRRERLASAFSVLHERGNALVKSMWSGLSEIKGVTLYGPEPALHRTRTISIKVKGKHSRDVAVALADRSVFVSHGDFYAMTVVERLGLSDQGLVRAGCGIYTTADEVSRLCEGVRALR
jgi:selenocysteine lyase/cysteine desulfurase